MEGKELRNAVAALRRHVNEHGGCVFTGELANEGPSHEKCAFAIDLEVGPPLVRILVPYKGIVVVSLGVDARVVDDDFGMSESRLDLLERVVY